jgi:RimJ/RimL family protein N-acetyltransferase
MEYLFKSERLGFRNWQQSDIVKMQEISSDPDVMEFFPYVATLQQTTEFVERMQKMFAETSYCYFAVDRLDTQEFIGFIGLCDQDYKVPFCPMTDIGWRLNKKHWGNGFATEGAQKCLDYAFNEIGLKEVYSTAPRINEKSWSVMKKSGMELHLEFNHPNLKDDERLADFLCYKITNKNSI